jgi:hypothetical protein
VKVYILGAGPAGMFAAHAAHALGHTPVLFAEKARKSTMFGAQYLHAPIPGLSRRDPYEVQYKLLGNSDGYRRKVYGPEAVNPVSPEVLSSTHKAWDIREAYDRAWEAYGWRVLPVGRLKMVDVVRLRESEPAAPILSTLPLVDLCSNRNHSFVETSVWAMGDAPPISQRVSIDCPPFTVICSGRPEDVWYRVSNIYGHKTVEWPLSASYADGVDPAAAIVNKPVRTSCTCLRGISVVGLGRYGTWRKDVLSHHAYETACEVLSNAG